MQPRTLIIRTEGTNCDRELAHAFELAGSTTETVYLNRLINEPGMIDEAQLVGFPGGFSYGDDIAAGRIFANKLRGKLFDPLREAVGRGVAMIGICNGFQVLVKLGLLPDPSVGRQTVTLGGNTCGRFVDQWVRLEVDRQTRCIWTRGLDTIDMPIAHGEGRFVVDTEGTLGQLKNNGQVVLRYVTSVSHDVKSGGESFMGNPNGSVDDIAGICDRTGLVLGLMPHPERYTHLTHHPCWTRQDGGDVEPAGLRMLRNAVDQAQAAAVGSG